LRTAKILRKGGESEAIRNNPKSFAKSWGFVRKGGKKMNENKASIKATWLERWGAAFFV
jgi:hypothetical protein